MGVSESTLPQSLLMEHELSLRRNALKAEKMRAQSTLGNMALHGAMNTGLQEGHLSLAVERLKR